MAQKAATLGDLRRSGYEPVSVKDEMRRNLVCRLRRGETVFPGIVGYEETVIPQIVDAILSRHHFILLGLRGQAKSRIVRQLVSLLDDEVPVVAGSEVNDDPFHPISKQARERIEAEGDATPIVWLPREARYVEKLATPDVTTADLIGDLDPIRAAHGGHVLSDELAIHFGLLPRANRGIFAINELPDMSGKVQVGLFNVMQEGDIQIKGFPVRLPLDVQLVFTANPEDYTARGKIITPLKDRIGSEILTHYPKSLADAERITADEAWTDRGTAVSIPAFVRGLVERIAFAAREDRRIDRRSGVSQRMPITVMEDAVSSAERRAFGLDEWPAVVRVTDVQAALPAITGKLELEYEGELQGGEAVARDLVGTAVEETFDAFFDVEDAEGIVAWFENGGVLRLSESSRSGAQLAGYRKVEGLVDLVQVSEILPEGAGEGELVAACELVLEGLAAKRRISRLDAGGYGRAPAGRRPRGPGGTPGVDPGAPPGPLFA
ncbi:MAG: sigma 54-interacting transcriptional regulator [Gemmatimonadota bacterium]|nr:sigma 54-interacting transcriptional regulator [Gemmatimonadota bacterium]